MTETSADFLFEIGCEEIPAGLLRAAAKELKAILEKYLTAYNLLDDVAVETFAAPRRLESPRRALVRSIWFVSTGEMAARLVTAYPVSGANQ